MWLIPIPICCACQLFAFDYFNSSDQFLYVGCLCCYSWRYRLQNIFPWSRKHSKPGYYLSSWWLLLPYILWYVGQITVCFTSAILLYIFYWNSFVSLFLSASSYASECTPTRPGIMQARGDNLLSILKAFTNSSKLLSAREREYLEATTNDYKDERAIFFDYLSWFIVRCKTYNICSIQCFIICTNILTYLWLTMRSYYDLN